MCEYFVYFLFFPFQTMYWLHATRILAQMFEAEFQSFTRKNIAIDIGHTYHDLFLFVFYIRHIKVDFAYKVETKSFFKTL